MADDSFHYVDVGEPPEGFVTNKGFNYNEDKGEKTASQVFEESLKGEAAARYKGPYTEVKLVRELTAQDLKKRPASTIDKGFDVWRYYPQFDDWNRGWIQNPFEIQLVKANVQNADEWRKACIWNGYTFKRLTLRYECGQQWLRVQKTDDQTYWTPDGGFDHAMGEFADAEHVHLYSVIPGKTYL
jgi:hypothetical protein